MAKTRLNAEEAFMNIMGKTPDSRHDTEESLQNVMTLSTATEKNGLVTSQKEQLKEKFVQAAFYITKKQHQALKIKAALCEKPEDKDRSSIVRAALDVYLADTLRNL